jgi:hypothetical protein
MQGEAVKSRARHFRICRGGGSKFGKEKTIGRHTIGSAPVRGNTGRVNVAKWLREGKGAVGVLLHGMQGNFFGVMYVFDI